MELKVMAVATRRANEVAIRQGMYVPGAVIHSTAGVNLDLAPNGAVAARQRLWTGFNAPDGPQFAGRVNAEHGPALLKLGNPIEHPKSPQEFERIAASLPDGESFVAGVIDDTPFSWRGRLETLDAGARRAVDDLQGLSWRVSPDQQF